jgi:hypothetical protein
VDPGLFVAVQAEKVDAASPQTSVPGAVFDLYRMDGGSGSNQPAAPGDAVSMSGATWVARSSTGTSGLTAFPLELPGYAYCVIEHEAPANFVPRSGTTCTGVLSGSATPTPPVVTTIVVADPRATVSLSAHKYNSEQPDTVIPGATYDLYIQGSLPADGAPSLQPPNVVAISGDAWYARGTTDAGGNLNFTVPAGYAWCLLEVTAPLDYRLDPALHCTAVLTTSSPLETTTIALPETLAAISLSAHKFNALQTDTVIPGASYDLYVQGSPPPGDGGSSAPPEAVVVSGDAWYARGTTDNGGNLSFTIPAGYAWCLHEVSAPTGYQADPSMHCTAVLTTASTGGDATIALPEQPVLPKLPFTGGPSPVVPLAGLAALSLGGLILGARRRTHSSTGTGA